MKGKYCAKIGWRNIIRLDLNNFYCRDTSVIARTCIDHLKDHFVLAN